MNLRSFYTLQPQKLRINLLKNVCMLEKNHQSSSLCKVSTKPKSFRWLCDRAFDWQKRERSIIKDTSKAADIKGLFLI